MSKSKKKHGSAFAVLFVILLLLSVAFTVCSNVVFSGDRVPMIAGYYLYLHEKADMEPDIPANSLVIAKEAEQSSLQPGSKVLCYLSDGNMALRVIYNIDVNEEGTTLYYPGTALEQGNELTIGRSNIFAVCIWASKEMYTVIQFATSVIGLMALLVGPCIILIIMLLVKIAKSSRDDDDEDEDDLLYDDFEEEEELPRRKRSSKGPLFDPDSMEEDSLEKKKASIQENFAEKPVNENSPYQKAVQERTMKFKKIEQEDIERAKRATAAARAASGSLYQPPQQQEESTPAVPIQQQGEAAAPAAIAETQQAKPYVPTHSADVPVVRSSEPEEERPAAPNIDDIINPSQLRAAKAGQRYNPDISGTDSINDLIAALEKEKKKL